MLLVMVGQAKQHIFSVFNLAFYITIHFSIYGYLAIGTLEVARIRYIRKHQGSPYGNEVCFVVVILVEGNFYPLLPLLFKQIKPAPVAEEVEQENDKQ